MWRDNRAPMWWLKNMTVTALSAKNQQITETTDTDTNRTSNYTKITEILEIMLKGNKNVVLLNTNKKGRRWRKRQNKQSWEVVCSWIEKCIIIFSMQWLGCV